MVSARPECIGITTPAAVSYPTRELAGHTLRDLPGGLFVMGGEDEYANEPRWIDLAPYSIGQTAVSENQYRTVLNHAGVEVASPDHPVTMITYYDAMEYLAARGNGLRLPTAAEYENAVRGPAVSMQEVMEEETGKFTPGDFADYAEDRFENFVFETSGKIFTNPAEDQHFREMIEKGMPFWGWRVYGTQSGRLTHYEAWYDKDAMNSVEWGQQNAYGLKGMGGGVGTWLGHDFDVENHFLPVPGGGWCYDETFEGYQDYLSQLRASFLGGIPSDDTYRYLGLRVAADLPSK